MSLAGDIKALMAEQGLSGRELAARSGIDPGLLSRYLNGKSALSIRSLESVLAVFGFELAMKKKKKQ